MKFTKLGFIVGLVYWVTERVWDNPEILWSLLYLVIGGAFVGAIMDFIYRSRKQIHPRIKSDRDHLKEKKQEVFEKLRQKKAARDETDCL